MQMCSRAAPIHGDAEFLDAAAQIVIAPAAIAGAAPQRAFPGHVVAGPQMLHLVANRLDNARPFMAKAHRIAVGRRIATVIERQIGGADPHRLDLDADLPAARLGDIDRLLPDPAIAGQDQGIRRYLTRHDHAARGDRRQVCSTAMQCRAMSSARSL
jgi:hypothetical protein